MGITIQAREDHMINAQINHLIEAMEFDHEMDHSTIRMGTGETMGTPLVLHRIKGVTSHKITHIAKQEVINLTILPSADLTIDPRRVLHPMNESFRKTMNRQHLMWFASPQPTIPLRNCRISAR